MNHMWWSESLQMTVCDQAVSSRCSHFDVAGPRQHQTKRSGDKLWGRWHSTLWYFFTTGVRFCFNKLFEWKKLLLHAPPIRVSIHCHLLDAFATRTHRPPMRYDSRLKYDAIRFIACGTILQVTVWYSAWLYDAHLSWCRANQCVHLLIKIKLNRPLSTVHIYFYRRLA